jgi:glycosyltransferase involved in cell wall biosynthesis
LNEILAFGPEAQRWASILRAGGSRDHTTLVVDRFGAVDAIMAAVELRVRGTELDIALLIPDRRAVVAAAAAEHAMRSASYDERRLLLDAVGLGVYVLNGVPVAQLPCFDGPTVAAMNILPWLAERTLFRSRAEEQRARYLLTALSGHTAIVSPNDAEVPDPAPTAPNGSVVVWGVGCGLGYLAIVSTALAELHRETVIVTAPEEGANALAQATVVVAVAHDDPGTARALARWGVPLCVASTSGAVEYLDGAVAFDPWNRSSVLRAALTALGSEPPRERPSSPPQAPTRVVAQVKDAPLVSICVRTYDRPRLLRRALLSIAAQTYPYVETVVVNDAGPDVGHIVSDLPNVRLIVQPKNDFRLVSNVAVKACRGEYIGRLDDDDLYFPDHVARLVEALERSGSAVAYSNALLGYVEGAEDLRVTSYLNFDRNVVERSKMLVANQLIAGLLTVMIKSAAIRDAGWFSESLYYAEDYELCLRLLRTQDFVHVDRTTALYSRFITLANTSTSTDNRLLDAHRIVYATHPVGDRPSLLGARRQVIDYLERHGNLGMTPPQYRFPKPVRLPGYETEEHSRPAT